MSSDAAALGITQAEERMTKTHLNLTYLLGQLGTGVHVYELAWLEPLWPTPPHETKPDTQRITIILFLNVTKCPLKMYNTKVNFWQTSQTLRISDWEPTTTPLLCCLFEAAALSLIRICNGGLAKAQLWHGQMSPRLLVLLQATVTVVSPIRLL